MMLDCGHEPSPHSGITTGYGVDVEGKKYCYDCCARRDREQMLRDGRATMYLVSEALNGYTTHKMTNWPGSLSLPVYRVKKGHHNIAGTRHDFWFALAGDTWHGVQYGESTQIAHCRRLKAKGV